MSLSPDAVVDHVAGVLGDLRAAAPDLAGELDRLAAAMAAPPRYLILGRAKAGKSTLVNALLRRRVAEVAVLECTDEVTVYAEGLPEGREELAWPGAGADGGTGGARSGISLRRLSSAALRNLSLVDTPGLGTLDFRNRGLVDRAGGLRRDADPAGPASVDAAVYVFDSVLRADEVALLRGLGFGSPATVGALSRADEFGAGAFGEADPVAAARAEAARIAGAHPELLGSVHAVSGLLAETADAGGVDEALAAIAARLSGLDRRDALRALESEAPTAALPEPGQRVALLSRLGAHGALSGADAAAGGAAALADLLRERSGIADLRARLLGAGAYAARLNRAAKILDAAGALAYRAADPGAARAALHARDEAPMRWRIDLYRTLPVLEADELAADTAALVRTAIHADRLADLAGVGYAADAGEVRAGLAARGRELGGILAGFPSPAEEEALSVLRGVLTRAAAAARGEIPDAAVLG
ncbi:GTPase [Corynebacterium sphenisci]|uniref:GTPase n=1 Tax=Corynebacterium sphenisci TaxID=191493 RepID=UPI0026DF195D|nr:GTPase [Corynebacterium sphenisci]MDO5730493.1 50S ribosome-binding GTPase [Corynebacterium sphenisci]